MTRTEFIVDCLLGEIIHYCFCWCESCQSLCANAHCIVPGTVVVSRSRRLLRSQTDSMLS